MLFQTLTGRVPYPRDALAREAVRPLRGAAAVGHRARPRGARGPRRRDRHALAKDPASRYQSAGDLARAALAAVDRPSLARGVSRLAAGESAPGWHWKTPAPRQRRRPAPGRADRASSRAAPFVGRAEVARAAARALRARGRRAARQVVAARAASRGSARRGWRRARARGPRARRDRALRPLGPRVARPLPAVRDRRPALHGAPRHVALPAELEPELSELARLVPALRRHLPELREPIAEDPETRRYRLFEAVTRAARVRRRASAPTVLILDDLQWADTSTALLLGHLLRDAEADAAARARHLPRRRDIAARSCPRCSAARPRAGVRADRAAAASTRAETERARRRLRRARRERLVRRCACSEGTEGNPFFIKETLRSLAEAAPRATSSARSPAAGPGRRQGARSSTRLARLSDTARQVLTVASVVGREFRLELLEELIDEPVERHHRRAGGGGRGRARATRSPTTPTASCSRRRSCARRSTSARARAGACGCTTGSR